ncbi:MAG: thioredoxin [Candidatus Pacearchaeota archaeon]
MAKEKVLELTQSKFKEFIEKNNISIVDFYAEWCMPCVMMAPVLESVAEDFKNIKFAKINVDDAQETAEKYQISSIPCIIIFKEGKEIDRIIGGMSEESLKNMIKEIIER